MFGFGNSEKAKVYAALIDISSGSVGVGIVVSNQESLSPTLLYTHRINMRITKYDSVKADDLRRVREALFSASLILSQEGYLALREHDPHAKITKIFVTCSAPWSFTLVQNVEYENDIRFKVSNGIISDLIKSAMMEISNNLKDNPSFVSDGFETVEQTTTDVKINDYAVSNPIGLSGTSISLSHIVGIVPKEISSGVQEVHEKLFKNSTYNIHTFIIVMFYVIRDLFKNVHSMCIINITGEATEFGIAEHGILIENTNLPYGSNSFVREIMQLTGKPQSDVLSSMHAYLENTHTSTSDVEKCIETYSDQVAVSLKKILERRLIPREVCITVHGPHERIFREVIAKAFKKVASGEKHIILIEPNIIDHIVEGNTTDTYLAFGARFFHISQLLGNNQRS